MLCYLEGMTYEMAASHLGVTEGVVRGRLARARDRLRARLTRRGLAIPAGLADADHSPESPRALALGLASSTARIATYLAAGRAASFSPSATVAALAEGAIKTMIMTRATGIAATLLAIGIPATGALVLAQRGPTPETQPRQPAADPAARRPAPEAPGALERLSHGDGRADGKKSLGGSGEMIEFTLPADGRKVAGVRIHGSRYGMPTPPDESFLIYFLNEDQTEVVATRMAPYSLFERGTERWAEVAFPKPVEVPRRFWVALDFRAHQSKGAYISFDASTGGKFSRAGLPGVRPKEIDYGDWMIEVVLAK